MNKIWYCPTCGYEIGSRGRCHLCRQRLVASPLAPLAAGDEDDEVGYRVEDWTDRGRGRLIEALVADGVVHRFEDDELVVAADDEERVDEMVARVAAEADDDLDDAGVAGAGPEAGDFDLDAEVADSVRLLHRAARRLRVDPTDMEADGEVAEASAGVFLADSFGEADADTWAAVGRVTRRLLAALGSDDALDDEISRQAAVLATLLGPVVAEADAVVAAAAAAVVDTAAAGDEVVDAAAVDTGVVDTGVVDAAADMPAADAEVADTVDPVVADTVHPVVDAALPVVAVTGSPAAGAESDAAVDPAGDGGPRLLGGGPETSYEAPEWLPEQRALLTVLLEERHIVHVWDGSDLVVPSDDEPAVEELFDKIGGVSDDEDDEERYRALEELFAAVDRLANDPGDETRGADVVAASSAVEGPTPLGFDDGQWLALRRRARTLADAIEHDAHRDVVAGQATSLRDVLRQLV